MSRYTLGFIDALNVAAAMVRDAGHEKIATAIEDAPVGADTEPLTRERVLDWIVEQANRIEAIGPCARSNYDRRLLDLIRPLTVTDADALADLLVDAAAGRVR